MHGDLYCSYHLYTDVNCINLKRSHLIHVKSIEALAKRPVKCPQRLPYIDYNDKNSESHYYFKFHQQYLLGYS